MMPEALKSRLWIITVQCTGGIKTLKCENHNTFFLFRRHPLINKLNGYFFNSDLFSGVKISDCLLPCLRTVATVEEGTITNWDGFSMFSLMFNDEVRVKKTSVDRFRFMDSLNFFGSNLGLWPGLGLFQILEWIVGIFLVSRFLEKIRKRFIC